MKVVACLSISLFLCNYCCLSGNVIPTKIIEGSDAISITENDLGRGFKFNVGRGEDVFKNHVFYTQSVEVNPLTTSTQFSHVLVDYQSFRDSLEIGGMLEISYGDKFHGRAEARYFNENLSSSKQVTLVYRSRHTAFFKRLEPGTLELSYAADDLLKASPDSFADTFGTEFIDTIVYGAQLDVSFKVTSSEDIDDTAITAYLYGRINAKKISIEVEANFTLIDEDFNKKYDLEISSQALGISVDNSNANPSFDEVVEMIDDFNQKYTEQFENFDISDTPLLETIQPVGFMLSNTADRVEALNEFQQVVLKARMDEVAEVFYKARYWQAKLETMRKELENPYKIEEKYRTEVYNPYIIQWRNVMDKLDQKIDECLEFRSLPIAEIINGTTVVPEFYPDAADDDLVLGLIGKYYIKSPVQISDHEPLKDTYYIGYGIRKEGTVTMKPWMRGVLKRTHDDYSIADGDTPEELYRKAISYKDLDFSPGCPTGSTLTLKECEELAEEFDDFEVEVGYWEDFPSGCSKEIRDNDSFDDFYYNTNHANGKARVGKTEKFISVCRNAPFISDSFIQMPPGLVAECPTTSTLSREECVRAGLALGATLRDGDVVEGSWDNTPSGCFVNPGEDNAIHYSNNPHGKGGNGRYTSLCSKTSYN